VVWPAQERTYRSMLGQQVGHPGPVLSVHQAQYRDLACASSKQVCKSAGMLVLPMSAEGHFKSVQPTHEDARKPAAHLDGFDP
jgi:hypothetical protein